MSQVSDLLERARVAHDAGRLDEAEASYRRLLALEVQHAGLFNNLGLVLVAQAGEELAVDLEGGPAVAHAFLGARKAERDLAHLVSGHGLAPGFNPSILRPCAHASLSSPSRVASWRKSLTFSVLAMSSVIDAARNSTG